MMFPSLMLKITVGRASFCTQREYAQATGFSMVRVQGIQRVGLSS
jgi:hypothetical protein